jgi:hypothetical protein
MRTIAVVLCLLALTSAATAADETIAPKVPAANADTKASKAPAANAAKKTTKAPAAAKAVKMPALEKLSCRSGPNDEQVRLIVEAVKGRAMEFAFYSRLGTRVCSIHGRRGDGHTKWEDDDGAAGKASIKLFTGSALLEYTPGHVKVKFTDVDRMHYCGMYGELNGLVEVVLKKPDCVMQGVFEGSGNQEQKAPAAGD